MYHINFENPCHVYFIGIGGISMSGLAEVLMKEGFTVSGSDSKESPLTDHLSSLGAVIFYDQSISHIPQGNRPKRQFGLQGSVHLVLADGDWKNLRRLG